MKKPYNRPKVTRVQIEDKQVVAMGACNSYLNDPNNRVDEYGNVVNRLGNALLAYDTSL